MEGSINMVQATTIKIQKIHIIKETEYEQRRYAFTALTCMHQSSYSDVKANPMKNRNQFSISLDHQSHDVDRYPFVNG